MESPEHVAERKQQEKIKKGNRIHGKERMASGTDDRDKSRNSRHILWLAEQENQVAIVHGKKTAVALRGAALRGWTEGGQITRFAERITTVEIGEVKLVAAYQPLWSNGREGVENYRAEVEQE